MSDLDRAIEAEIQSFQPHGTPPFDALITRSARRRELSGGTAAALGGVAAAVVGVIVTTSWLTPDRATPAVSLPEQSVPAVASPSATPAQPVVEYTYALSYTDSRAREQDQDDALKTCMALPGTHDGAIFLSSPAQYSVVVTGAEEIEAFEECITDIGNFDMTRAPSPETTTSRPSNTP